MGISCAASRNPALSKKLRNSLGPRKFFFAIMKEKKAVKNPFPYFFTPAGRKEGPAEWGRGDLTPDTGGDGNGEDL